MSSRSTSWRMPNLACTRYERRALHFVTTTFTARRSGQTRRRTIPERPQASLTYRHEPVAPVSPVIGHAERVGRYPRHRRGSVVSRRRQALGQTLGSPQAGPSRPPGVRPPPRQEQSRYACSVANSIVRSRCSTGPKQSSTDASFPRKAGKSASGPRCSSHRQSRSLITDHSLPARLTERCRLTPKAIRVAAWLLRAETGSVRPKPGRRCFTCLSRHLRQPRPRSPNSSKAR